MFYDLNVTPPGGGITQVLNTQTGRPANVGALITFNNPHEDIWRLPLGGNASPSEVDPTVKPAMTFPGYSGPFSFGGAQWCLALWTTLRVYKSMDGGLTWSQQDAAHEPAINGDSRINWDGVTNRAQAAYIDNNNFPILIEFDFTTGLWTAPHSENSTIVQAAGPNITGVQKLANGDVLLFYINSLPGPVRMAVLSGGAWTNNIQVSAQAFGAGQADQFTYSVVDATDTTHIFWWSQKVVPNNTQVYFYRSRSSGGAFSAIHQFDDVFAGDGSFESGVVANGNELVLPYKRQQIGVDPTIFPAVWRGTPLNAPVWTSELVDGSAFPNADLPFLGFAAAAAVLTLTCASSSASLGNPYLSFLLASGGTGPYTFAITAGALPTGLSLNVATGQISGSPSAIGVFAYTAQATDSLGATVTASCAITVRSLAVVCPSSIATFGVPYNSSVRASGGAPPYTFAITVGVLPPGLVLNGSTGLVSGIPTADGVFPYTVQVTDSNGLTGLASCSITVSGVLTLKFAGQKIYIPR